MVDRARCSRSTISHRVLAGNKAKEDKLANLAVPGVDAAMAAGKLLENLPDLWDEADLTDFIYGLKLL
jgi:hypothetical protein